MLCFIGAVLFVIACGSKLYPMRPVTRQHCKYTHTAHSQVWKRNSLTGVDVRVVRLYSVGVVLTGVHLKASLRRVVAFH